MCGCACACLPEQQLHDLQQEQAGRTALECQGGVLSPRLLLLPHQLMPQLLIERHAEPRSKERTELVL